MKKNLVQLLTLSTLICTLVINKAQAQKEEKQPFIFGVQPYYGFPNLFSDIVENKYENSYGYTEYSLHDFGPTGLRAEFFLNRHITLGVDANYASTQLEWVKSYNSYDPYTGTYIAKEYHYRVDAPRLRILSKFNAHFGSNEHFDWYVGAGVGYNSTQVTMTTNDPNENYRQESRFIFSTLPFCARVNTGATYYFIKNLGIGLEVGLGGPILSFGLNARF